MSSEPPKPDAHLPQEVPQSPQRRPETLQPEQAQPQQGQRFVASITQEQWSGPIPPPAVLERLDQVIPGGAERVLRMAEKEQAHRIAYEREGLGASKRDARRGQYLGAAISLAAIVGAVISVFMGAHPTVPIALVSIPIAAIVRAVVNRRTNGKRES